MTIVDWIIGNDNKVMLVFVRFFTCGVVKQKRG